LANTFQTVYNNIGLNIPREAMHW